ncbi:hypothetical protein DOTSEDRAFT_24940 [Dothistroma septosporum NZE10]|uniref:Oxidase ustYa n=1 Tax=Dothistroma septosporum (strain NZE10 / CBS 128990) TaxID=675120 RepID=M2YM22_DOTSN|nr:hypothetical protein DOTSEDRAFT_24940 [Dothistroma septosporum NZE10]
MKLHESRLGHRLVYVLTITSAIVLLLATTMWLLVNGMWTHVESLVVHRVCGANPLAEELNSLVPEFPRQPQVFWNDSAYGPQRMREDLTPDDVVSLLQRWHRLIPPTMGFVPIQTPERYTLPPPLRWDLDDPRPIGSMYSISVFHQIHCLDGILRAFLHDKVTVPKGNAHSNAVEDDIHIFHCFDYLRQAVMCHGDTALEGADEYEVAEGKDVWSYGTYGIGTTHLCKDWDAVYDYAAWSLA